ncbi:putative fungal specific transcription factor [Fonsecaea pedrosoi]|nr:putative fungal specific transcription factor [Fonsecaea pedrosoi]
MTAAQHRTAFASDITLERASRASLETYTTATSDTLITSTTEMALGRDAMGAPDAPPEIRPSQQQTPISTSRITPMPDPHVFGIVDKSTNSSPGWSRSEAIKSPRYDDGRVRADGQEERSIDKQERSSIYSAESSYYEYHGPRSFLSICSKPGIQWVTDRCGCSGFQESAITFTREIMRPLKMEKRMSPVRAPEPSANDACVYARCFFEAAPAARFGVVQQSWFESRLRAHLNGLDTSEDPAWYALRNIIYATGSRLHLAKTATFQEASQTSWEFFENALSMHTEILYFRSSLIGVQALSLMREAYFVDELGSPALEYMLCSNALRLACSKGLHRQAVASWGLTDQEACHRDWIFWAIYCLEKSIASRSGRPSITDDNDISCPIPVCGPTGSSVDVVYCNMLIRLSQLSSLVNKQLSSAQAFQLKPGETIKTVVALDQQLRALKDSMAYVFRVDAPINPATLPSSIKLNQALHLQFMYYNLLSEIHNALTYPWSQTMLRPQDNFEDRKQVEASRSIVAEAARALILATKWVHLDANCPILLAFSAPIQAVIDLFIHILQAPESPTVQSDLSLLDIGAGHFARVEFATNSEISTSFVKQLASFARVAVKHAKSAILNSGGPSATRGSVGVENISKEIDMMCNQNHLQHGDMTQEASDFELSDFQPESLSMLLPGLDLDTETNDFFNWEL